MGAPEASKRRKSKVSPTKQRLFTGLFFCPECGDRYDIQDLKELDVVCDDCDEPLTLCDTQPELEPERPLPRMMACYACVKCGILWGLHGSKSDEFQGKSPDIGMLPQCVKPDYLHKWVHLTTIQLWPKP